MLKNLLYLLTIYQKEVGRKKKKSWPNNDNNNTGIFISETEQLFTMTIPAIYIYMIYMLFNGKHLLSIIQ